MERSRGNFFILSAKRTNETEEKRKVDGEERERRRKAGRRGGKVKKKKKSQVQILFRVLTNIFLGTLFKILRFNFYKWEELGLVRWLSGYVESTLPCVV